MNNDFTDAAEKQAGVSSKEINGNKYSIKLLPASVGLEVTQKLIKGLSPALGVVLDSNEELDFIESSFYTDIAIAISQGLPDLDTTNLIRVLLKDSYCDSKLIDFETHFVANYGTLIALVEFALKENFGSFFTDYLKAKGLEIPTLRAMMSQSKAPTQNQSEVE